MMMVDSTERFRVPNFYITCINLLVGARIVRRTTPSWRRKQEAARNNNQY